MRTEKTFAIRERFGMRNDIENAVPYIHTVNGTEYVCINGVFALTGDMVLFDWNPNNETPKEVIEIFQDTIICSNGRGDANQHHKVIPIISHKEGFKSLAGKEIAYRLKDGDIEVIAVVNDTIEDYECFEVLEMDTQLPWNIPEAHFLLGIK